jgi:pimeloyl-ACP methyl ester carboxylesterase
LTQLLTDFLFLEREDVDEPKYAVFAQRCARARRLGGWLQLERRLEQLQRDGYSVIAPQFPLTTLADNVARLRQVLADQAGPTLLVGHSYGGQIITALGTDAPNVIGLVYIAGFGLDEGESIQDLVSQGLRLRQQRTCASMQKVSPGCRKKIL